MFKKILFAVAIAACFERRYPFQPLQQRLGRQFPVLVVRQSQLSLQSRVYMLKIHKITAWILKVHRNAVLLQLIY
jgi:hypothetical protein